MLKHKMSRVSILKLQGVGLVESKQMFGNLNPNLNSHRVTGSVLTYHFRIKVHYCLMWCWTAWGGD